MSQPTSSGGARSLALALVLAALLGLTYYKTFRGSLILETRMNAVAFADASDYIQLLSNGHFLACTTTEPPHHIEHRRKTVHHAGYLFVASAMLTAVRPFLGGQDEVAAIWLISPLIGALNFVLAFYLFKRTLPGPLVLPAVLTYGVAPAIWIYASVPETWMYSGTAVLVALHAREYPVRPWVAGLFIALFALTNFLLLFLVLLVQNDRLSPRDRVIRVLRTAAVAGAAWFGLLVFLGLVLSPDFLPHRFVMLTVQFKGLMAENLSVFHPARWAYTFVNGWLAPFVLNQPHLNFGRWAVIESAARFPLGMASVLLLAILAGRLVWTAASACLVRWRAGAPWSEQVSSEAVYLAMVFIAGGLALYYESFLYSPMIIPVLIGLAFRALPASGGAVALAWTAVIVWTLNTAQQLVVFRSALGL